MLRWKKLIGCCLCGVLNVLITVRGIWIAEYSVWLWVTAIAVVAVVAGVLTPEKPSYTALVLALGGILPVGHVPITVGLIPFFDPPSVVMTLVFLGAVVICYLPYRLLVQIGWRLRQRFAVERE